MHRVTLEAGTSYFGLVFGAGLALGLIRVPFLVPHLGTRTSELLEMPVMLAVIVLAARFACARFKVPAAVGARVAVGCLAFILLLIAELAAARLFQGQSPVRYVASRDPVSGAVYALMLVVFALMPVTLAVLSVRRR